MLKHYYSRPVSLAIGSVLRLPAAPGHPAIRGCVVAAGGIPGARAVEVTFSGGTLFVAVNGGEKRPVLPQSETNFSGTGLSYQFIRDDHGIATHVIEGHVSGDYKYERQK